MALVIGADIGTTSAKAVAFDSSGVAHGDGGERPYELSSPEPGWAEQDPRAVVDAALAAIRDAASTAGSEVEGVAFSAAMHSLVGLDASDRPLTPLVTWADTRAVEQAERLRSSSPELHDATGTPIHPMAPLSKLVWFAEERPEVFDSVRRWCGIKGLVLHELCGEWAIDRSCASGTGLMSMASMDWHGPSLEAAGISRDRLPALVSTKERFALSASGARAVGLPEGLPVVIGAGDGPLANLGVGAVRPGVAACSIGTSGALRVMVEEPRVDRARRVFCYYLAEGRWVTGGAINNGGVVLQWAGDALAPDLGEHPEDELMRLASGVPAGSDGLMMLPYLLSERAPHWSAVPRGAYVGLTRSHGRAHLVRAALEGVCQQLALVLASVRDAGNEVDAVRATGGFARSDLWRQMLASVFGMEIEFPDTHEGSAFGAALLGMEALGLIDSFDLAGDLVHIEERVAPDPADAEVYAELLGVFANLYEPLQPAFRALRRLQLD